MVAILVVFSVGVDVVICLLHTVSYYLAVEESTVNSDDVSLVS